MSQTKTFTAPWSGAGDVVLGVTVTDNTGAVSAEATVTVSVLPPTRFIKLGGVLRPLETVVVRP